MTRLSTSFLPTLREDPADAESVSHRLMVRAWLVRQVGAGVWTWLPFDEPVQTMVAQICLKLATAVFIRSGDAVHLATAALHGFSEIHSHDRHLLNAASEFGLKGLDVLP